MDVADVWQDASIWIHCGFQKRQQSLLCFRHGQRDEASRGGLVTTTAEHGGDGVDVDSRLGTKRDANSAVAFLEERRNQNPIDGSSVVHDPFGVLGGRSRF